MKKIDAKYLPTVEVQKAIIQEQISESQRLIFRNGLEVLDGEKNHNDQLVTSSEYNIRTLCKKIDLLTEELEKL